MTHYGQEVMPRPYTIHNLIHSDTHRFSTSTTTSQKPERTTICTMPARVDPIRERHYDELRATGWTQTEACRRAKVSKGWARLHDRNVREQRLAQQLAGTGPCPHCGLTRQ